MTVPAPSLADTRPLPDANDHRTAATSGDRAPILVTVTATVVVTQTVESAAGQSPGTGITETVTIFTTEPQESPRPVPATSLPPNVPPQAPFGNSSLPAYSSSPGFSLVPAVPSPSPTAAVASPSESALPVSSGYENAVYFTNWGIYGANYQPQSIPASKITRVYYAFASFGSDGTVNSSDPYADLQKHYAADSWSEAGNNAYGCVKQLFLLKKQNRQLKVMLSIGGWNDSPRFAAVAASAAARETFARSAVELVTDWGFDGIDLDWEYPAGAAQASDLVELLAELRGQLSAWTAAHAPGYRLLLTAASSAGPDHYGALDLGAADRHLDSWNLMAYDYAGSWDKTSGHQANLFADAGNAAATKYSTDRAIGDYMAKGVAASKILLGLPAYGRAFDETEGLGRPFSGVGPGSATLQTPGLWLYKDLPRPGATELYDEAAGASYSYDAPARELISYDSAGSARKKASYLKGKGLAGSFLWEASGDKQGAESLVGTLAEELATLNSEPNLLSYPTSQYDNIRSGLPGL